MREDILNPLLGKRQEFTAAIGRITYDKIMLKKSLGLEVLGLYSFAYAVGLLLTSVVVYPLLSAWTPEYFEDMNSKNYVN